MIEDRFVGTDYIRSRFYLSVGNKIQTGTNSHGLELTTGTESFRDQFDVYADRGSYTSLSYVFDRPTLNIALGATYFSRRELHHDLTQGP